MAALAWVEVLDRRGHVRARHRVDASPALIGRGYGCDVLIDDPWVSPIHARIFRELDGSLSVEDAGSENGLFTLDGTPLTSHRVGQGVTLRAGHALLRIVPADAPIAATLGAGVAAPEAGGWERPWLGPALGVLASLWYAVDRLLSDADVHRGSALVGDAFTVVLALACWAGVWALITRAASQRARFTAHLAIASLAVIAGIVIMALSEYAAFLAPGTPAVEGIVGSLLIVTGAVLLFGHLMIATSLPVARALAISVAVIFGLTALGAIAASDDDHGRLMPQFAAELKPLRAGVIPAQDTTEFYGGIVELKREVDSLAALRR